MWKGISSTPHWVPSDTLSTCKCGCLGWNTFMWTSKGSPFRAAFLNLLSHSVSALQSLPARACFLVNPSFMFYLVNKSCPSPPNPQISYLRPFLTQVTVFHFSFLSLTLLLKIPVTFGKLSNRKSNETWELVQIGGGFVKKSKKVPSFSLEKFKIRGGVGGLRKSKKVPCSGGHQLLKHNDSFSSYEDQKTH